MQQSCPKAPRTVPLPEPREFVAEPRWALRLTLLLGAAVVIVVCATQVVETLGVPERTRRAPAVAIAAGHAPANPQPVDIAASRVERTGIPVVELTNALRDGLDSEVVRLSTAADERRLREWSQTFAHAGGALTFFKRATTAADRRTYGLSFDGASIVGELCVARDEHGHWCVVKTAAASAPTAR
ncbi:MAG: hypothetical protein ACKVX7_16125 [Planctomycetota bacterium]